MIDRAIRHPLWLRALQESDRIGTGVEASDSKLGAVMGRRESLGDRARGKLDGNHPVMCGTEEENGAPLRDTACADVKVAPDRSPRSKKQIVPLLPVPRNAPG